MAKLFPATPKDELKIIDAGAGTGMACIELQKRGYTNVYALDISQAMLNEAKKKNVPYKRFICAPLTEKRIPEIETGEFDALISAGVLLKAHVRPSAFVEMIRMVKTGESGGRKKRFLDIDKSVLVENRPLVKFIRNQIRESSGAFFISSLVRISMTSFPALTLLFVQKYSCLYNKNKIALWLEDTKFIFSW